MMWWQKIFVSRHTFAVKENYHRMEEWVADGFRDHPDALGYFFAGGGRTTVALNGPSFILEFSAR